MKETIPNTNPVPAKKRAKLRAINAGTHYDIAGGLRRTTRAIENGEYGPVTDVVIIARYIHPKHGVCSSGVHFGTQAVEGVSYMVSRYLERLHG